MRFSSVAIVGSLALVGCVVGGSGGAKMIGQPETALYSSFGTPDRQLTAPSGAKIDVWDTRSMNGQNVLCSTSYFVRDGTIVGYSERGAAVNCSGKAGVAE